MQKLIIITLLLASVIRGVAAATDDDFNANTITAVAALQKWYDASGLWTSVGWWNDANCIDAIESAIEAGNDNGQNYLTVLTNTFTRNSATNFENTYYDDEGWWTEAWIKAYDLTGNVEFLNMAKTIFSNVTNGWDSECSGGVWWDKTKTYKNAIPNELFLLNAIRLHGRTPGDSGVNSYIYWATNEWLWFSNSGMINSGSLINDGLTSNCVNNGETTWTYNQGVILGGLTELYKATGNSNYLSEAEKLANASTTKLIYSSGVLQEPCEVDGGCGGGDVPEFKGIFIRNLICLYDEDHKTAYYNFLYNNAHAVWTDDQNSSNQFGLIWVGPLDSADATRQSSAIMPISALAEPSTALLFYAKGSGDPAFNHSVGQSAGTLAWTSPANTSNPGYLQYGPYLTSLPAGAHTAHFRIAVNALSNSPADLLHLIIIDNNLTIASALVAWNQFTQANLAQDFPVAFTNATGDNLEFRVYWNQIANAPVETLIDTTVDGAHNWTAANLNHQIGRLDGLNAWEADPIRDTVSGYLTEGPGTAELAAGPYAAKFELKVDNFNYDDSTIATLSVVNVDANTVVVSQPVSRSQFANTLYRTFALNFQAIAGVHYDFRVFWNYAANAPRLTQRSVVVAPVGATSFVPVPLSPGSYTEDMVVENTAPAVPNGTYTMASMDEGTGNTGTSWYEVGYNTSSPSTGLPAAGSTITSLYASNYSYTLAGSYAAANAAMIDATHSATIAPATPAAYSALSFLAAAGHGPVTIDYAVHHSDGSSEPGAMVVPDWFNNAPSAFVAAGRVDVVSGAFQVVGSSNPNLYSLDVWLTNTSSPVSNITFSRDSVNSGSDLAAIFAVSGLAPNIAPDNVTITPMTQTQYAGLGASFSVTAGGTPPFSYQWESNGGIIDGATNSILTLTDLSTNEDATYSCIVSNNTGLVTSSNAILTVLPPPVLQAAFSAGVLVLAWPTNCLLLMASNVTGPWITNAAATSPWPVTPTAPAMFYQLQAQ